MYSYYLRLFCIVRNNLCKFTVVDLWGIISTWSEYTMKVITLLSLRVGFSDRILTSDCKSDIGLKKLGSVVRLAGVNKIIILAFIIEARRLHLWKPALNISSSCGLIQSSYLFFTFEGLLQVLYNWGTNWSLARPPPTILGSPEVYSGTRIVETNWWIVYNELEHLLGRWLWTYIYSTVDQKKNWLTQP